VMLNEQILKAASIMRRSRRTIVFTGAGLSVESGIPPFRGSDGVWAIQNPLLLHIGFFYDHPKECWGFIKRTFYDVIEKARPNQAHHAIAELEREGYVHAVVTQNFDNLHQDAGSRMVYEYHGTIKKLQCLSCQKRFFRETIDLEDLPPYCPECGGILKPDMVFFGEPIPEEMNRASFREAENAEVMLLVGTTGTIMPAAYIPRAAKDGGAFIIEVNVSETAFTQTLTDIFLSGLATQIMTRLARSIMRN
jgi:NAD-dependent deacetylase